MEKIIKVLVVDDSLFFQKLISQKLSAYKQIKIVDIASNAVEANSKIIKHRPDVVTLDIEMPGMSGLEFLKQLIPKNPVPVVLVSSLDLSVFEALSAGAVDFVRKPDMSKDYTLTAFIKELSSKINAASTAKVKRELPIDVRADVPLSRSMKNINTIIAIGASTGGTDAIYDILKFLPSYTPGIVITQHMPAGFTKMFADRLNRLCDMEVKEAAHGDVIRQGLVLIAPGDLHMRIEKKGSDFCISCTPGEKVSGHRPSVDVLFESVAKTAKKNAVGILLTGMGQDGAKGLLNMKKNGAYTIGQDEESCVVYGMPMVAYNLGAVTVQAPLNEIARLLKIYLNE